MQTYTFKSDSDLWLVINALGDKAGHWREIADELRTAIGDGKIHRTHSSLVKQFERQAQDADRIRDALIDDEG